MQSTQQLSSLMPAPTSARTKDLLAPTKIPPEDPSGSDVDAHRGTLADFEILEKLGQGGNASVHRALWKKTGEKVALKIIHGELASDPKYLARFRREVRATARLQHPNICRVLAWGEEGGKLFLALELIDGGSLRDLVDRAGPLPPPVAAVMIHQLLSALGAAHAAGILHRDVKPANAMVTREGVLKLVDFGIAKGENDATVTETGFLVGTPAYMSPEQAVGREIDARTDLYAAGVSLYELLIGKNPYADDAPSQALLRIATEPLPSVFEQDPTVPGALENVLEGLVERSVDLRFASADDAIAALRPYLAFVNEVHPTLAADFVAAPETTKETLRLEQAELEHARAEQLLLAGEANLAAAALALYRAQLLASTIQIAHRFEHVCARGGFRFRVEDDEPIRETKAALRTSPNPAGLLKRLADLYRARGDIHHAVVYLRRYLRVRPNDSHAQTQLELLVAGVASPTPGPAGKLQTRDILAGIKTGGWAAISPERKEQALALQRPRVGVTLSSTSVPRPAPVTAHSPSPLPPSASERSAVRMRIAAAAKAPRVSSPAETSSEGMAEAWSAAWEGGGRRLIALGGVLCLAGGLFWLGSRMLDAAVATTERAGADLALSTGSIEENSAARKQEALLTECRMLANDGDWTRVVTRTTQLMALPRVPAAMALEALLFRARAHEQLGAKNAALADVNEYLKKAPLNDPGYDRARAMQRALIGAP